MKNVLLGVVVLALLALPAYAGGAEFARVTDSGQTAVYAQTARVMHRAMQMPVQTQVLEEPPQMVASPATEYASGSGRLVLPRALPDLVVRDLRVVEDEKGFL